MKITKAQICTGVTLDLGAGYTAQVTCADDPDCEPPWIGADGYGPVSEWTSRNKLNGERTLSSDGGMHRYYDWSEALRLAKGDDGGVEEGLSKRAKAIKAVAADFEYLRAWCNGEWRYIGVCVQVWYRGATFAHAQDAFWGVEDRGDYWQDVAYEMLASIIRGHQVELHAQAARRRIESKERRYWEARGVMTK